MRKRFSEIKNCELGSVDGVIGKVTDLLIEDDSWTIRYLVVDLDDSFPQRRVLISTAAIEDVETHERLVVTSLNSQQVLDSPPLDFDQPVTRRYEKILVDYYSWPIYWLGRAVQISPQTMNRMASDNATPSFEKNVDSNLRSASEICGYQIQSRNGQAGVLKDLVFRTSSWTVEFGTAESNSWTPRESSMFSTKHIDLVDWSNRRIVVDLSKAVLEPVKHPPITGEPYSSHPFRTGFVDLPEAQRH